MSAPRLIVAIVATTVLGVAMAHGSAAIIPWYGAEASELRLSWRAVPERVETCRALSADELAARPAHMRQALECEGRSATYLLRVVVDGATMDSVVVRGGGARNDRPMFVLRRHAIPTGPHEVRVTFERIERLDAVERSARSAIPPLVALDTVLGFEAGVARSITLDRDRFVVRGP